MLIPETDENIVDVASGNDDLSTLVSLLSNYPDLVEALTDEAGNFTVFAPTNAAFDEISDITATLTSDQIKEVLQYHVIDSRVYSSDLSDGQSPEMLNGETITINIDGSVTITDKSEASEDATVTATDVQTITGVVHIIDKVIIPEL
ncbi:MAG: fasciclin domain-containing protein [bacterium]|nr:fasciclin domain-containing protein [bacterium]